MKDIVLIPCHQRDDFLSVTLSYIEKATLSEEYQYWFLLDRGFNNNLLPIISSFPLDKKIIKRKHHHYFGNSYNILEGYKEVYEAGVEYIYLIEEDIFIAKSFFEFHKAIRCNGTIVSACKNQHNTLTGCGIYSHPMFQSLGLCWHRNALEPVLHHAKEEYYSSMRNYVKRTFPNSVLSDCYCEQDGLIQHVFETLNYHTTYTYSPKAYHAGFIGYNRLGIPLEGSLEERCKQLKTMTKADFNNRAEVYKDIEPIELGE